MHIMITFLRGAPLCHTYLQVVCAITIGDLTSFIKICELIYAHTIRIKLALDVWNGLAIVNMDETLPGRQPDKCQVRVFVIVLRDSYDNF